MFSSNKGNGYIALLSAAIRNYKIVLGTFIVIGLGFLLSGSPHEEALGWSLILTLFVAPIVGLLFHVTKSIKG